MTQYDVFLSHNSQDKPAVEELARRLTKAGIQPWLDKWNLIPGEPWQEAIENALDNCATCTVFIGPSGTGPWQNEEMRVAIQRRVDERREGERSFRVIPVLLPGAERGERSRLPSFLVAATWVEFRQTLADEDAFHRLVCGIRGQPPGPTPGEAIYEGQCPYRGLAYFDVQHAPFFFGREARIDWLLSDLRGWLEASREWQNAYYWLPRRHESGCDTTKSKISCIAADGDQRRLARIGGWAQYNTPSSCVNATMSEAVSVGV